ncbi:MAG: hypothetical protein FWE22_02910 [Firmicutes bacterium]|nr:hypothetical protein [Bacillota bacterium]
MESFNQTTLERQSMNPHFRRRSGARRFGLALYLIGSILMIALFFVTMFGYFDFLLNYLSRDLFEATIILSTALVLIQTIYYIIMLSSSANLQKPYRSAVVAILFFPLFGFTHLLYVGFERSDKRRTSRLNFYPIANEFGKIEEAANEVDKIISRREGQISFWTGTPDNIESLTPQVKKQVNALEETVERFLKVFREHGLGVFYRDALAVKFMFESAINAKARGYRAKDMEMFFDRHVDAVKTCKIYLNNK